MNRSDIIAANPIAVYMERQGVQLRRAGKEWVCLCPLHEDRNASFRINSDKQTWFCDPCGIGGSIIDLVAKLQGVSVGEAMRILGGDAELQEQPKTGASIVGIYAYHDESGAQLFQVVRLEPKTFRQRHKVNGEWSWSMDCVRRVLYNLPAVIASQFVWIVEGEKDANTLINAGLCATCNVGGAGKWSADYTETLRDKDLVLCGDNDEPGRKHVEKVLEATAGIVKTTRVVSLPSSVKDVSDFFATFSDKLAGVDALISLAESAETLHRGVRVPIRSMNELEQEYRAFVAKVESVSLDLGAWLPSFHRVVRPIVPGEVVGIVADTGVGKTMLLQNLCLHTRLPTLLFELELPNTLTFERFAAMATRSPAAHVHTQYLLQADVPWRATARLDHIHVCAESRLTPAEIEKIINKAGLKIGHAPRLVLIDYVQLIRGEGTGRYDRMSNVAEELKVIAKATDTIIVVASQIHRKGSEETGEIFIHDAKDSGSIENSAGLMLGAWRDPQEKHRLWLKVMKNTKGNAGQKVACYVHNSLLINEEKLDAKDETIATLFRVKLS